MLDVLSSPNRLDSHEARARLRSAHATWLRHDLLIFGLAARDSRSLRNALARASIVVDTELDEGAVRVPVPGTSLSSTQEILALINTWALRRGLKQIPLSYGRQVRDSALGVEARSCW